jgi:hypothetical protein
MGGKHRMKHLIPVMVILLLVSTSFVGIGNLGEESKTDNLDNLHTVLGEYSTITTCTSKYPYLALKEIFKQEYHPFNFLTLVCDKNTHAYQRAVNELYLLEYPTLFLDGGYLSIVGEGNYSSIYQQYNESIEDCSHREVADLDITLDIEWLGAVNPNPPNGTTNFSCRGLSWDVCAMNINCTVKNNELEQYDGHLHVYVAEINSSYWIDFYHCPYVFAFLDYAWNEEIEISSEDTWEDSMEWNGADYNNGDEENLTIFNDIFQDNTILIASVLAENTKYTDETESKIAGINTEPKTYTIYFGNTTPPPKVIENQTSKSYIPGFLEWNTTYYWKVDVWDNQGKCISGPIWSFTTCNNSAPYPPTNPIPPNGSINVTKGILRWNCSDPDNDTLYYDVYFGPTYPPELVSEEQQANCFIIPELNFNTTYYWRIIAYDRWGGLTEGPDWHFTTAENYPPYTPYDLYPQNGSYIDLIDVILSWKGGDPIEWDEIYYEIYFEKNNPDPGFFTTIGPFSGSQVNFSYELEDDLDLYETYYWKIVAIDSQGLSEESYVHKFHTQRFYGPKITGPTKGKIKVEYDYNFVQSSPVVPISYFIDWGDGSTTGWTEYYDAGVVITRSHSWDEKGNYIIGAMTKDIFGRESPWSNLPIKMPHSFHSFWWLNNLLDRFPLLQRLLEVLIK